MAFEGAWRCVGNRTERGVVLPAATRADTGAIGRDFGGHVVMCAQTMGFNGQHNPGMHRGFAGWDPAHMC